MRKIWFYDNDYNNQPSENRQEIVFKKVRDSPPPKGRLKVMSRWGGLNKHYPEITYSQTEPYDQVSGITKLQCDKLKLAVQAGLVLCVVFDWDRTLSKTEGLYGMSETEPYGLPFPGEKTVKEYREALGEGFEKLDDYGFVSYFFNDVDDYDKGKKKSEKRAAKIGDLINFLYNYEIPIFVLTNSGIGYHSPGIMSQMLNILAKRKIMYPENILFNDEGNKEITIRKKIYEKLLSRGIITNEMIAQWDATAIQSQQAHNKRKYSQYIIEPQTDAPPRKKRSCPTPDCTIMGGKRKTRKGKKGRKRRKTNRRRKRKRKSSKTRKLNV